MELVLPLGESTALFCFSFAEPWMLMQLSAASGSVVDFITKSSKLELRDAEGGECESVADCCNTWSAT